MANSESAVQIIPYYSQPHVHTVIFDHTQYEETVASIPDPDDLPFATLAVTGADEGIDNTLVKLSRLDVKRALFGRSNFRKYGQPSLQAEAYFNGSTNVWFCRVLPDNATYANVIVLAKFREGKILDELGQETGKSRLEIKFSTVYANRPKITEGAKDEEIIQELAESMTSLKADAEDGYMTVPLFFVRSIGRGKYGNKYSIGVTRDTDAEKEYGMKMYSFNLITRQPSTKIQKQFCGSIYETVKSGVSTMIGDVLDQYATGSCPINIVSFSANHEILYDFYQKIVAKNAAYLEASGASEEELEELKLAQEMPVENFDPIFGIQMDTRTNESIPYYQNYSAKVDDTWEDPDLTIAGPEAAIMTAAEGGIEEDEPTTPDKPKNISEWNTAAVGAKVLVCVDPFHEGMRYLYTVVSIDAETGDITYDEGISVAMDADQFDGVRLNTDVGVPLTGGWDGDFEEITVDGVTRAPTEAEMKLLLSREYVKVFRGLKDRKILSPARVNLDFIFDANYNMTTAESLSSTGTTTMYGNYNILTDQDYQTLSVIGGSSTLIDMSDLNVKKAIYDLNEFRNRNGMNVSNLEGAGCSVYFDCGLVGMKKIGVNFELQAIIESMKEIIGRANSVDLGYFEIYDPESKKRIKVTVTYFLAKNMIPHIVKYGINEPFVMDYAVLRAFQRDSALMLTGDMIKNSFRPDIDLIDWDVKEALFKNRINYYVGSNEGRTVRRYCQNTRQLDASALLEENNVRVLNTFKKGLEENCTGYLYKINNPTVRKAYTKAQMDIYSPWIGTFVEDLKIWFDANEFEQERMMMHCYADVKFFDIAKRITLEINVRRPDYSNSENS